MDWYVLWDYRWSLLNGLTLTIWLSAVSIVGSTIVGVVVGCLGTLPSFFLRRATGTYVETMRNIPVVVKLFFLHFIFGLDAIPAGILSLVLHQSAYIADVITAGLRSIPTGQTEAALSCGHSRSQVFQYILVPQALRIVIPPLTTQYIQVVKNSAVVMLIALEDLTFQTQLIEHQTFRGFEASTAVTVLYLLIVLVIAVLMTLAHKRLVRS